MGLGRAVWPHPGGTPANALFFALISGAPSSAVAFRAKPKNLDRSLHHWDQAQPGPAALFLQLTKHRGLAWYCQGFQGGRYQ